MTGRHDSGARRRGHLQGDLGRVNDLQSLLKVPDVEGDLRLLAVDGGIHLADVFAGVLGAGAHPQPARYKFLARKDVEPHDVIVVAGKNLRDPGRLKKFLGVDNNPAGVGLRNELVEVGEGALNKLRNQLDGPDPRRIRLNPEEQLGPVRLDGDLDGVVAVGNDPLELVEGPGRDDDLNFFPLGDRRKERGLPNRKSEPVGGGKQTLVAGEPGVDPGQHRPGVVSGGRERDLLDDTPENPGVHRGRRGLCHGRNRRKIVGVEAVDPGLKPGALHLQNVPRYGKVDPVGRKRVDKLGEDLGRHSHGPFGLNLRPDPDGDGDFQVRGREPEPPAIGRNKDVARDGKGTAGCDGPANNAQPPAEVFLKTGRLHGSLLQTAILR